MSDVLGRGEQGPRMLDEARAKTFFGNDMPRHLRVRLNAGDHTPLPLRRASVTEYGRFEYGGLPDRLRTVLCRSRFDYRAIADELLGRLYVSAGRFSCGTTTAIVAIHAEATNSVTVYRCHRRFATCLTNRPSSATAPGGHPFPIQPTRTEPRRRRRGCGDAGRLRKDPVRGSQATSGRHPLFATPPHRCSHPTQWPLADAHDVYFETVVRSCQQPLFIAFACVD